MLAQEAARTHRHDSIGTEHLLLGLLGEPRGLAYEVLVAKTESEQRIRDATGEALPPAGHKALPGHIPFRPESKDAIEQTLRASADLGHDWVGTEHMLLGLIRTDGSPAARILRDLGFTPDELRESVQAGIARRSTTPDHR
ncbi:Clp protease N-terminal domain-containing protein [Streptomyces sp. NPDC048279]|uniref:Clp protease N-terminal domain-containing protein n=1 Tax=Streptomyces sp. NPDC048279 TaxID=3154714 RepID=UPI003434FC27